ncbi:MAG: UDP-N-acetylmuramoyl-L-alanyl-D-glutamate--2,6-diaminopimelate ligase [Acidimicrobiia bacterium]|nr:UDP-N-acetylmuramoyl-L-alanyl-D-glutamate--2,6-diaminopimelate ligase [Acidimicrobiia bacterium]MDH3397498.1 UDP-N-acetylmuramoyl-L-alanyl-D-glutamate--2,6-diaminopimelate ligase [Acidimicrobiia bacterium]
MLPEVRLAELAEAVGGEVIGSDQTPILDVTHDSRQAGPGVLFAAVRGFTSDGHDFLAQAVANGASAVCVEARQDLAVPQLVVADCRAALPRMAATVHHHPSRRLRVVGVTGTNGKTTVAYLVESIATAAGLRSAVVGTIGARIAGRPVPVGRTTPEATDLQRLLARMVEEDVDLAAVEVSSHALALHRVDEVVFAVSAFTNLTQDHLDFHHNMEDYFRAKASLFQPGRSDQAVIWVDDPYGSQLAAGLAIPVTRVGMSLDADVRAQAIEVTPTGSRFELIVRDGSCRVELPLGGAFNIENALIAGACAAALGLTLDDIDRGFRSVAQIPGRFEKIDAGQEFAVIVDYAHTPEGIAAVVAAARSVSHGNVIVVIGAGGDRDRLKRPRMGEAARQADVAIITSDNPRSEDPLAIIDELVAGTGKGNGAVQVVPDRRLAIRTALRMASTDDVVLILGKGHEQGQEVSGRVQPFDDRVVAGEELAGLEVAP